MSSAHFSVGLFFIVVVECKSCLYILEISLLSVASFANIFPRSVGHLFVLFIYVFIFAVQKLISVIRFYLFIFISIAWGG